MVEPEAAADELLRTQRLTVRRWRLEEADRLYDILRRPDIVRWMGGEPMREDAEAVVLIERYAARLEADPRFGAWAILERPSAVPAGTVLLKALPDGQGEIEIGWHLHPDSWGRGLATEAAAAVLAHGFRCGLPEVWAVTHLDNGPSIAVAGRIGMRLLGVTERWYHVPSLMFWSGSDPASAPSLEPDRPAP